MQLLQEKTKMTFEDKLKKLEELTETVKNPETSLEDALKAFEEGIKTARTLEKEIETIEGKVQILMNSPDLCEEEEKAEEKKESTKKSRKSKKAKEEVIDIFKPEPPIDEAHTIYDNSSLEFDLFDSPELQD